MFEQTFNLETVLDTISDLDITPSGDWTAITERGPLQHLSFAGKKVEVPKEIWYPKVRALQNDLALIVDPRTRTEMNAWIISSSGEVVQNFFAGDAIQDVLVSDRFIVISYFDESALYGGIEGNGVAVFDNLGNYEFGYRELFGDQAVDIADCYCTSWADQNRVLFYPYTDFPVVCFDLLNKTQTVHDGPSETVGSGALSSRGDFVYFHAPYKDKNGLFKWRVGESNAAKVGSYSARLRGLNDGQFIAVGKSGYTIVTPE